MTDQNTGEWPSAIGTLDSPAQPVQVVPRRQVRFIIALGCLLCGREFGEAESAAWPPRGALTLRRTGYAPVLISHWRHLRCTACLGTIVAEMTPVLSRIEEPIDWRSDKPRRGRPPTKLTQARKAIERVAASPTIGP